MSIKSKEFLRQTATVKQQGEIRTTVALLHDIVENTDMTFEELEKLRFPQVVINSLKLLTDNERDDSFEYIKNRRVSSA